MHKRPLRFMLFALIPILAPTFSATAAEMSNIMQFATTPQPEKEVEKAEVFDMFSALESITKNRPVIGIGMVNVITFIDFDDHLSLKLLNNLVKAARANPRIKITIVYYAPTKQIREQKAAILSTAVYNTVSHRRHLLYLESAIALYGKQNKALATAIKRARIAPTLLTHSKENEQNAIKIIEENNKIGHAITNMSRGPITIVEGRMIVGYVPYKAIMPTINGILLAKYKNRAVLNALARVEMQQN